jgi:hypothetical protein
MSIAKNTVGTDPDEAPSLDAFWMPFSSNRWFREHPKLITGGVTPPRTAASSSTRPRACGA